MKRERNFRIYRNLHKGNFSIQTYLKDKSGYRVTDRAYTIMLYNSKFIVYESGRQKVLKEKRKNVHAFVEFSSYGFILDRFDNNELREIYYNPYQFSSFVYKDTKEPVQQLSKVIAHDNKLYDASELDLKTV